MLRRFLIAACLAALTIPAASAAKTKKKTTKSTASPRRPRSRSRYSSRPTARQSLQNQQRRDARRAERRTDQRLAQASRNKMRNAGEKIPRSVKVAKANAKLQAPVNAATPGGRRLKFAKDQNVRYFDKTKPASTVGASGSGGGRRGSADSSTSTLLPRLQRNPWTGELTVPPALQ